jgi:hypothetical protein
MFPRSFLIALFAASVATANAEQMLFEDTFGQPLPRNNGSRDAGHGWEGGTELRQSGPLAPVKYTHNGAEWRVQNQLNDLAKGVESRFFTLPDKWLLVGPAWELDSADGSYEVVFEFSPPDANSQTAGGKEKRPPASAAEAALVIGQEQTAAGTLPDPQSIAVVVQTDPGVPSPVWVDGAEVAAFEPNPAGPSVRVVTIRWKQKKGAVSDIEAELDGQTIKISQTLPSGLGAPKVQIGGPWSPDSGLRGQPFQLPHRAPARLRQKAKPITDLTASSLRTLGSVGQFPHEPVVARNHQMTTENYDKEDQPAAGGRGHCPCDVLARSGRRS